VSAAQQQKVELSTLIIATTRHGPSGGLAMLTNAGMAALAGETTRTLGATTSPDGLDGTAEGILISFDLHSASPASTQ
jgi:hypothetical protein